MITYDFLLNEEITICQPKNGFRVTIDPIILSWFVQTKKNDLVLDIGSGSGIISILLAIKKNINEIDAVEIDEDMFECLTKSIEANKLNNNIFCYHSDILNFKPNNKKYDLIISNPPYMNKFSGRVSKIASEQKARFDSTLDIETLVKYAKKLVKNRGKLAFCGKAERLPEIISILRKEKFEPKRLLFFYGNNIKKAKLFFMESIFQGGIDLIVEFPLLYNSLLFNKITKGVW